MRSLVVPHVRHVCVLLPLVMLNVRHARLGLYIWVSLKGKATHIWSFGYSFVCAITTGCVGFKLSFGIIIIF